MKSEQKYGISKYQIVHKKDFLILNFFITNSFYRMSNLKIDYVLFCDKSCDIADLF